MNKKPELLAPAGNLQKLKTAFYFGADAVYLGGKQFSLRTFADNFTEEELAEGVRYARERGKKVYACANIFARNSDFARLPDYFLFLREIGVDAVLISDPGVFRVCRKVAPDLPVHVSTQANTTNAQSAAMWKELGASRVVLARELSLGEIAQIHAENPELELEAFVHGAMCISYSGRCLLSDYLDGRSSNRGACAQACRYEYELRARDREDGGWLSVGEDGKGTYFLNSKDLNMSAHLAELAAAGVVSFKIEGRMKSEYYLATVVNAYHRLYAGRKRANGFARGFADQGNVRIYRRGKRRAGGAGNRGDARSVLRGGRAGNSLSERIVCKILPRFESARSERRAVRGRQAGAGEIYLRLPLPAVGRGYFTAENGKIIEKYRTVAFRIVGTRFFI